VIDGIIVAESNRRAWGDQVTATFAGAGQQPQTKTDIAYTNIRKAILEGVLAPGQVLDQAELSKSLSLSTTPVREALRRLEAQRLVVSRAHRDTIVAPLSLDDLEDAYAVRLALDPLAGELAVKNITPAEIAEARAIASDRTPRDPVEHLYLNRRLHRIIYHASRNSVLINTLESLWDMTDRYRLVTLQEGIAAVADEEHLEIVEAIARGNGQRTHALILLHTADSLDRIRNMVTASAVAADAES
jgi:DNA-binding GntR family transcriptional regulator